MKYFTFKSFLIVTLSGIVLCAGLPLGTGIALLSANNTLIPWYLVCPVMLLIWLVTGFTMHRLTHLSMVTHLLAQSICFLPVYSYYFIKPEFVEFATYFIILAAVALQVWLVLCFRENLAFETPSTERSYPGKDLLREYFSSFRNQPLIFYLCLITFGVCILFYCAGIYTKIPVFSPAIPYVVPEKQILKVPQVTIEQGELFLPLDNAPLNVLIKGTCVSEKESVAEFFFWKDNPLNWEVFVLSSDPNTPSGFGRVRESRFINFPDEFNLMRHEEPLEFEIILFNGKAWFKSGSIASMMVSGKRFAGNGCGLLCVKGKTRFDNLEYISIKTVGYPSRTILRMAALCICIIIICLVINSASYSLIRTMVHMPSGQLNRFIIYGLNLPLVLLPVLVLDTLYNYHVTWAGFYLVWITGLISLLFLVNTRRLSNVILTTAAICFIFPFSLDCLLRTLPMPYPINEIFAGNIIRYPGKPGGLLWYFNPSTRNFSTILHHCGFRWRCFSYQKPPDTFRIFFLGSSSTWGHGLKTPGTWGCDLTGNTVEDYPALIGKQLSEKFPEKNIESVNAAVPAYSMFTIHHYFREFINGLQPDLIVVNLVWNNTNRIHLLTEHDTWQPWILRQSRHETYLHNFIFSSPFCIFSRYVKLKTMHAPVSRISSEQYHSYLEQIILSAQTNEVDILLVIEPSRNLNMDQPIVQPYLKSLADLAAQYNVQVVDPTFLMKQYDTKRMFMDYIHLHPFGHELMAKAILPHILKSEFFRSDP